MNNIFSRTKEEGKKPPSLKGKVKIKELIFIAILAIILLFAVWKVFRGNGQQEENASLFATDNEKRVAHILEEIEGVGKAEVVVYEDENGVKSVVVVCEGANNFSVIMDIREAVAAALGTEEKAVKVYLKKD